MSIRRTLASLALAASTFAAPAVAQEVGAKPTEEHTILAADEGTWDAAIKTYAGGPDNEPSVSKGVEVNQVMAGGLWVLSRFEGTFGPAKFEGRGQYGYDPAKKAYVGTWIDSWTPALMNLEGTYDAKTKTITFVGERYDPQSKSKFTQTMATATKDDGTRVFTLYMKYAEQKEKTKFMEVTYTKRKP